ncbi:hypothetical protein [Noviherbaspirillum sp. Root189]|uniref:hypothetical protein n=1 Tax=Noviherbaspirillum sp. Root189 TaxID=1736487 RepID=UPI00070D0FF8|nr:hypothetical protein [Noviherbaspirillum sp. Root189]KRB70497.1 hypothetical protein ASE07_07745 [Noviherbaspirillum sp. Root189]
MKKTEQLFAIVSGGIVQNIIVADKSFADLIAPDYDAVAECTGNPDAYIGGEYVNGAFVPRPEPVSDAA